MTPRLTSATGWQPMDHGDVYTRLDRQAWGKKRKTPGKATAAWQEAWKGLPCAVCAAKPAVAGHHICHRQHLPDKSVWWDPRNCLPVCFDCHGAHHGASKRIPLSVLSEDARAFAEELGLGYLLERYYS